MTTLAERIRSSRENVGLSQSDVAKSLRVSASAVNQWEQGLSKNLKLTHLFALANLLRQDPQWLGTGTIFPGQHRTRAAPPSQPASPINREENALLHHFRQLPEKPRRQLLQFLRGINDWSDSPA